MRTHPSKKQSVVVKAWPPYQSWSNQESQPHPLFWDLLALYLDSSLAVSDLLRVVFQGAAGLIQTQGAQLLSQVLFQVVLDRSEQPVAVMDDDNDDDDDDDI